MKIITGCLFVLNITAWVAFDIVCWWFTGASMGVVGVLGIISFLIAWGISGEASLSISDYIVQSEWEVFASKLKWANITTIIVMFIFIVVFLAFNWFDLRAYLDISL